MKNSKDFYAFNDAVHNSVKTVLNDVGDKARNMTVFVLVDDGDSNFRCVSVTSGKYSAASWLAIATSIFRQCVNNLADSRKAGLSLEEGRFRAYQATLTACIAGGMNTTEDE